MVSCPKPLNDEDKWIALCLLSFLIKSDAEMRSLEVDYFKGQISEALGADSMELEYFEELMCRPFDPDDFEIIDTPQDKVVAKHILKEAMRLSLADGDYSSYEKDALRTWAEKNDLEEFFLDDLETYMSCKIRRGRRARVPADQLEKMGEDLLNSERSSAETHSFFSGMRA